MRLKAAEERDGLFLDIKGPIATIVADRRERRNAMSRAMWRTLPSLVGEAEADPGVSVIVMRGAHGHFSAGNDIAEFGALRGDPEAAEAFGREMATAMQAVEDAAKPVIMAIEGACYGAAVALALAGDIRVAADDATFAITPAKLGALYLRSDLHRLVAAVGQGRAKRLIYAAEPIEAARAERIGLIDEVVPADRFDAELGRLYDAILRGSPFTLRRTKQMLATVGDAPTPAETRESLAAFVEATQGADFTEGVDAFLARRTPRFR